MRFISADFIFPISSEPIAKGVIQVDDDGSIIKVGTKDSFPTVDIQHHSGIILPGFVNAHCHLELSHMKDLCDTGVGLVRFIEKVVSLRSFDADIIKDAIQKYDAYMFNNGIQAVGDICNKIDTADTKSSSSIYYYSFVEMFDLLQKQLTLSTIENYREVFTHFDTSGKNKKSFVPHAPYSVTSELFDFINKANAAEKCVSIHNQETPDEMSLFQNGQGQFNRFFSSIGLTLDGFVPTGKSSINYVLENLRPHFRNLFVHNTLTTAQDIQEAENWSDRVYWVSCPNANLYIENRLPNYSHFLENQSKVCLGTDSIMSNWQLSIWEEIKTIKKYQSYVPLQQLFTWATINGAEALSFDSLLGTLEPGKKPGLVNIDMSWKGEDSDIGHSRPTRII